MTCSRGVCDAGTAWCVQLGDHAPTEELCALGAGGDAAATKACRDGIGRDIHEELALDAFFDAV